VTPAAGREPRSLPPGRALLWFGEAIRLWKRGPLAFSLMALVVIACAAALEPLPMVGAALGTIPTIGAKLTAVCGNLQLGVCGAFATALAIFLYHMVMGTLTGLTADAPKGRRAAA